MGKVIDQNLIVLNSDADHYSDVLKILGEMMIKKGYANPNYVEGLLEREAIYPTGIATETIGVALPHTDSDFVKESKIGMLVLDEPVKFGMMGGDDGEEVDVKIAFLLGLSEGNEHLQVLQEIIQLIQDKNFINELLSISTRKEAYQLLNKRLIL